MTPRDAFAFAIGVFPKLNPYRIDGIPSQAMADDLERLKKCFAFAVAEAPGIDEPEIIHSVRQWIVQVNFTHPALDGVLAISLSIPPGAPVSTHWQYLKPPLPGHEVEWAEFLGRVSTFAAGWRAFAESLL